MSVRITYATRMKLRNVLPGALTLRPRRSAHTIICLLLALQLFTMLSSTASAEPHMGLYFNQQASANCAPQALYTPLSAYLIITEADSLGSVTGWEANISSDPGLLLSQTHLAGDGLNVQVPPDYSVGLHSPLEASSTVVLAEFAVFAISPGGIYLKASTNPSRPDCVLPIVATAQEPGALLAVPLAYGSVSQPTATIGDPDCSGLLQDLSLTRAEASSYVETASLENDVAYQAFATATMPSGEGPGSFGWSTQESGPSRCGVQDFDVLDNGDLAILDVINHRVALLSSDAAWLGSYPYDPELALTRLAVRDNRVFLGAADAHSYELSPGGALRECAQDSASIAFQLDKGEPVIVCDGERVSDHETALIVRARQSPEPPLQRITFLHDGSLAVIAPIVYTLLNNRLFLLMYYRSSPESLVLRGEVVVVDSDGAIVGRVELPNSRSDCLRQSVKISESGIVWCIATGELGVEVTTWHLVQY